MQRALFLFLASLVLEKRRERQKLPVAEVHKGRHDRSGGVPGGIKRTPFWILQNSSASVQCWPCGEYQPDSSFEDCLPAVQPSIGTTSTMPIARGVHCDRPSRMRKSSGTEPSQAACRATSTLERMPVAVVNATSRFRKHCTARVTCPLQSTTIRNSEEIGSSAAWARSAKVAIP